MAKKTNRQKYRTFGDYVLKEDRFVLGFLMTASKWGGAIIFTALAVLVFQYSIFFGILIGIFALLGWRNVYNFHKLGGMKAMPKIGTGEFVWGKKE